MLEARSRVSSATPGTIAPPAASGATPAASGATPAAVIALAAILAAAVAGAFTVVPRFRVPAGEAGPVSSRNP